MTGVEPGSPDDAYVRMSAKELDGFRLELEQARRFRMQELEGLSNDKAIRPAPHDEVATALMAAAEAVVADITAALYRIQTGSFGLCQQCGNPIAMDRLEALPMVDLCMGCQFVNETNQPRQVQRSAPRDIVDIWGFGSFPASDPPANW